MPLDLSMEKHENLDCQEEMFVMFRWGLSSAGRRVSAI